MRLLIIQAYVGLALPRIHGMHEKDYLKIGNWQFFTDVLPNSEAALPALRFRKFHESPKSMVSASIDCLTKVLA